MGRGWGVGKKSKNRQALWPWARPLPSWGLSLPICRVEFANELYEDPSISPGHRGCWKGLS